MENTQIGSRKFSYSQLLMDDMTNESMPQSQSSYQINMGKKYDRTGKEKATWDPISSSIWIDICVDEVRAGNRPGTHFNKVGWTNVINKFFQATGRSYDKAQHKNRWDALKKEWQLWQSLVKGESGLGWDPIKQTVDATEEWWNAKTKKFSDAAKFKHKGLGHKEKLDILFLDIAATGETAWAPSSGVLPPHIQINSDNDSFAHVQNLDDQVPPNSENITNDGVDESVPIRSRKRSYNGSSGSRKGRISAARRLSTTLERIVEAVEKGPTHPISLDKPGCAIPEVLKIVQELPRVSHGDELFMFATELFLRRQYREMFVALEEPGLQLAWLQRMQQH